MANLYETMIVLNPNLEREAITTLMDSFKGIVARQGGTITSEHELGKKKFTYAVKKFSTGFYHLLYFVAPPATVFELERNLKHSEEVLKFLTLRLEEDELKHSKAVIEAMTATVTPAAVPVAKEEE